MPTPPHVLVLSDETYSLVKTRLHSDVSVYRGACSYLRIGTEALVRREADFNNRLVALGFPVARVLREGMTDGRYYYEEESLGDTLLGQTFAAETAATGGVSEESFVTFVDLCGRWLRAQIASVESGLDAGRGFAEGAHLDVLSDEYPELAPRLHASFDRARARLADLPIVFSHGDFNPHNFFPSGIIDLDSGFTAPLGYDTVTALFHTYAFPDAGVAEVSRVYAWGAGERSRYLDAMDAVFVEAGYGPLSPYIDDFLMPRLFWSAARMHDRPRLRAWRRARLTPMLDAYLAGEPVAELYLRLTA